LALDRAADNLVTLLTVFRHGVGSEPKP
jgi:hypothetical protein